MQKQQTQKRQRQQHAAGHGRVVMAGSRTLVTADNHTKQAEHQFCDSLEPNWFKVQLTLLLLANWITRLIHFSITSETMQISLCATRFCSISICVKVQICVAMGTPKTGIANAKHDLYINSRIPNGWENELSEAPDGHYDKAQ